MLAGQLYDPTDAHLAAERQRARKLCKALDDSRHEEQELRARIIREFFARTGEAIWIERPFYCDYGSNITLGDKVF
jgi:maltose O-acetyltransferase